MTRKVLAVLGIMMLLVSLMPVSNAEAYTTKYKGLWVNTTHDGLRAIISTGNAGGNPPTFYFSALNPDTPDQNWYFSASPSYSCIAAGTEFYRKSVNTGGSGSTSSTFYVTNSCTGSYAYQISLSDATFKSKYLRVNTWNDTGTAFQDETYDLRLIKVSPTLPLWQAYLYNYNTSSYDFIAGVNGSNGSSNGGFFFTDAGGTQQDAGMYCPTLYAWGIFQMRGMQRSLNGTWFTLGSGDISYFNDTEYCFTNNTYEIKTGQPYRWKMVPYGVSY